MVSRRECDQPTAGPDKNDGATSAMKDSKMKKNRREALSRWIERLPGAKVLPFRIDGRGLYRISDLYNGYDLSKPESWTNAFDHTVYQWTLDPKTARARRLKAHEVIAERLHDV